MPKQTPNPKKDAAAASGGDPDCLDPRSDLKLTDLALTQRLSDWTAALSARAALRCHGCPGTAAQFALVRSEGALRRRVEGLAHELSDASLQQVGGGGGSLWGVDCAPWPACFLRLGLGRDLGGLHSAGACSVVLCVFLREGAR